MALESFRTHDEIGQRALLWGTAPPSSSDTGAEGGPFAVGDYIRNTSYEPGTSPVGWRCVTAGTPGTWRPEFDGPVPVRSAAAATTFDAEDDHTLVLDSAAATRAVTLPDPSTCKGVTACVIRDGANNVTVTAGAGKIGSALTTVTLGTDEASVTVRSTGSLWKIVASYGTVSIA